MNLLFIVLLIGCFLVSLCSSYCQDASPNCSAWNRNGFCSSTFYSHTDKKNHCAKTCNLCSSGSSGGSGRSHGGSSSSGGYSQSINSSVLNDNDGKLLLLMMGDTQYFFPCSTTNRPCKAHSAAYRAANGLNEYCSLSDSSRRNGQTRNIEAQCYKIESEYANKGQNSAIKNIYNALGTKPTAMILNGDLANDGQFYQLQLFKRYWMTMPFRIYLGLGNHDYENHVNKCQNNECLDNMMLWFINDYAPKHNLNLDVTQTNDMGKTHYKGSMDYRKDICNSGRDSCVHSVHLNNRPDYQFTATSQNKYTITQGWDFLRRALHRYQNEFWPVLINLHNFEKSETVYGVEKELKDWFNLPENRNKLRRPVVTFAHQHEKHWISIKCIGGVTVPFLYVGSVPNNRYTLAKFKKTYAEFYFIESTRTGENNMIYSTKFEWQRC